MGSVNKATTSRAAKARGEVTADTKTLKFKGREYVLPSKMPGDILRFDIEDPGPADMRGILLLLLGPEQCDEKVWDQGFSMDEIGDLFGALFDAYEDAEGESPA